MHEIGKPLSYLRALHHLRGFNARGLQRNATEEYERIEVHTLHPTVSPLRFPLILIRVRSEGRQLSPRLRSA